MKEEIKHALFAADAEAQYDEKVKRLLGNKIILAHILVKTVDEFQGMDPKDVVRYIEGEPFISVVPVEPGLTNAPVRKNTDGGGPAGSRKSGQRIMGMNTEYSEIGEGFVRFDIIFYVRMKDGISQMIVNLEAQKDAPSSYHLMNRAVYYVSRMISSQKQRDFVGMNYDEMMQGLKPLVKNFYFASKLNLEPYELHILFLGTYQGYFYPCGRGIPVLSLTLSPDFGHSSPNPSGK